MKKVFANGFILGAILFGSLTAFATTNYQAITATFPVLVNGKTLTTDKPIVVIDGSTYLPLKAIGEALGVGVNWNNDLKRVEIGETPKTEASAVKTQKENTTKFYQDTRNIIALSNFTFDYSHSYGMTEVVYDYKQLKDYSMISYTITFYNDKEERIGYGDGIAMNKVVGETTTESTYIDGDVRGARYIKVQVDVMM